MKLKTLLSAVLLATSSSLSFAQTAADWKNMNVDAHAWTKNVKMGWNLGNSFESQAGTWDDANSNFKEIKIEDRNEWETGWGNPKTTKAMLAAVKDAGFDTVRIPVLWGAHITDNSTNKIDDKWMNRVQEVVDWCMELDLKVIINTHHEYWLEYHPEYSRQTATNNKLKAIWTQIANHFKNYDARLAFAGVNEVQMDWKTPTAENTAVMNSYNQTFVNAVRATGGNNSKRNLIVQTYSCNPDYGLTGFSTPTDAASNRLSVEFHYYNPYSYCGDGIYYYWGTQYEKWGTVAPEKEDRLISLFKQCKEKWYDKGLGVIIGEYGVSCHYEDNAKSTQLENERYYNKVVNEEARKNGFAAFIWDNNTFGNGKEKFGIFDRNHNMRVLVPELLNGAQEGAGVEVKDYTKTPAFTFWEGNSKLNYGDGLQLQIPATEFENFSTNSNLYITLTLETAATYSQLQLFYTDWSTKIPLKLNGSSNNGEIDLKKVLSADKKEIRISFDDATIKVLKQKGLVLQGYGASLNKIIIDAAGTSTAISSTFRSKSSTNATIYDISGKKIGNTKSKTIYIRNGKKFFRM